MLCYALRISIVDPAGDDPDLDPTVGKKNPDPTVKYEFNHTEILDQTKTGSRSKLLSPNSGSGSAAYDN